MLLSSYNHEPLSGDCFEDSQALNQQAEMLPSSGPLANCSMQDHASLKPTDQGSACTPTRALRMKPQPNQVLKCPRCNSLNTKFCYYNNYSLTQPRHFCKNCRRYWTKGGALRNVPVGGGCRKNKRAKQKNSDQPSNGASADKTMSGSFSNETLSSRHGQLLAAGCSTSSLYDLAKDEDGIGLPYSRIPHAMRLADHSGTSNGLSFEIPRGPSQPPGVSFSSLPISLSAFDTGLSAAGTLNFQGLMKQENGGGGMNNGGEFTSMYDPSLNLLGPASAGSLSEGLSTFNIGLENFVGLGLNGDLKWRQQQQQSKIATLVEHEQNQDAAIHHHHQSLLHLEDADSMRQQTKGKSALVGMSSQDQVHEQVSHGSADWQGQQEAFLEPSGEATYWNTPAWPLDLPIYVDQQYSDVKPVEQAVSDFYHRAATMNRCTPSLT